MKIGACYGTLGFEPYLNADRFQWQPTYTSHGQDSNILEVEGYKVCVIEDLIWDTAISAGNSNSYLWNILELSSNLNQLLWNVLYGRIAVDSSSNSGGKVAQISYSWNHTCTGDNRFLAVDISIFFGGVTVSSITYNGVALSFIGAEDISGVIFNARVESWGLVAPALGTNSIVVTLSSSSSSVGMATSYTEVNQSSPTESFNTAEGTNVGAADATVNITPLTDFDWVHGAIVTNDTSITANQTSRNNVGLAFGSAANEDTGPITPISVTPLSYTNVGAGIGWVIIGYGIKPFTTTTLVGNISQLLWNIGQISGNTNQLLWNDLFIKGNNSTLLWNDKQISGNSNTVLWNDLLSCVGHADFLWNTNKLIGNTDTLLWNVLGPIGKSTTLLWNDRQILGNNNTALWNVGQTISANQTLLWNDLISATKSDGLFWNTIVLSSKDIGLLWNDAELSSKKISILWNTLSDLIPRLKAKDFRLIIVQELNDDEYD